MSGNNETTLNSNVFSKSYFKKVQNETQKPIRRRDWFDWWKFCFLLNSNLYNNIFNQRFRWPLCTQCFPFLESLNCLHTFPWPCDIFHWAWGERKKWEKKKKSMRRKRHVVSFWTIQPQLQNWNLRNSPTTVEEKLPRERSFS